MNKTINVKINAVQKEQVKLVKIERYLELLLGKVNESINELKVEELQLKSGIIEQLTTAQQDDRPTTSAQAAKHLNATTTAQNLLIKHEETAAQHMDENINKQLLALESLLVPLKQKSYDNEEEEEDDDDAEDEDDKDDDQDYKQNMEDDNETEEEEDGGDDEYIIQHL